MEPPLIVGAGPTGLAAALFLAKRGIRSRVVEKRATPSTLSKAFGVNARTRDLLEPTGVTAQLLAEGWRMQRVNIWRHGRRAAQANIASTGAPDPFMLILSQARTETLLERALAEHDVHVEREVELTSASVDGDSVRITLRHADGTEESYTPASVLAADGAHSTMRDSLHVDFPGTSMDDPWHLYDLDLDIPLPMDEGHVFLFDDGAALVLRLEGNTWRIIGNPPNPLERLPEGTQIGTIHWQSDFTFSHRVVSSFQVANAYFAGDAAHLHSPLGARGMNLGIEDAFAFAALTAENRLHDYDRLRRPVAERLVRQVRRITEIPRGKTAGSQVVRYFFPAIAPFLPLVIRHFGGWVLGLDHEVKLR